MRRPAAELPVQLNTLTIQRVRVVRETELAPAAGLNLIIGPNGSGKSSCLEAIYLLGLGRSFRSRTLREVITFGEESLLVRGEVENTAGETYSLGIERGSTRTRTRIAGREAGTASELARHLPLLLITPDSHRLLTDGTRLRRRMLDWALFHVEPTYLSAYQRYKQALRQRNAGLKQEDHRSSVSVWDAELELAGTELHSVRSNYIADMLATMQELVGNLLGRSIDITYYAGWDTSDPLAQVLARGLQTDLARGFTGAGPHRADLRFRVSGAPVQNVLSRGESKLFIAAVLLAQVAHTIRCQARTPVVLIDDLASELDPDNRARLLSVISQVGAQTFLTAVTGDMLDTQGWQERKTFHVEHGSLSEVV